LVKIPFSLDAPKKIRDKLDSGGLPRDTPEHMFAGYGNGKPCDGCETPILAAHVEYEFDAAEGRVIRLHLRCVGLWEAYRRRGEAAAQPSAEPPPSGRTTGA